MLHEFLGLNRDALIARCQEKVAKRPARSATEHELQYGIPLFLDQLIGALRLHLGDTAFAVAAVHPSPSPTEIGRTAARHGNEMLRMGFTVDQVVHDYGDLCQSVTEMVVEQGATVTADEFRTLNACLDEAIADAITEFGRQRDQFTADETRAANEHLGFLAHELRNLIGNAILAVAAIKKGTVGLSGATGTLLDRSLIGLRDLVDQTLVEARLKGGHRARAERISVAEFIDDVAVAAVLDAAARDLEFTVAGIGDGLVIEGDRHILASTVTNLLQNAVKFTRPHGRISLAVQAEADRVLIEVHDECGGLPEGTKDRMFRPFNQLGAARSGIGLGLAASRRGVEANGGRLHVRDRPGTGCVFTIDLPRARSA